MKEPRSYPNVFRVGYYGKGFPATVQNRQFVYRGNVNEQFSTCVASIPVRWAPLTSIPLCSFRERHLNKHPSAVALESQTAPDEELQNSDGQYIHICQVQPEPDKTFPIFQNPDVPAGKPLPVVPQRKPSTEGTGSAVRSYYEHNGTNTFSFETKFTKAAADHARNTAVPVEFLSTWSLRTTLVCADAFPTVLKRTEVIEVQHQEISPVEKALQNVEKSIADLQRNSRKFKAFHEVSSTFHTTSRLC